MNFQQSLDFFLPQIEAEMRRQMTPPGNTPDPFFGMLHYHLGWVTKDFSPVQAPTGKRLRPLFTLLTCRAMGGDPALAMPAAAAVELVHNFSLIHDDIEDDSATRRGRATVWNIWGAPQAINAGDALFVLARNGILSLREYGVPAETIIAAANRLDQTCLALCRGQYLDMSFEQTMAVTSADYLDMIRGKTSALLACAGYLGGLIATNDPARAEIFWELGMGLGMAFQIHDDLLGIWGQEAVTGKPAADDLRHRKKTLPVVIALNQPDNPAANQFIQLYRQPTSTENDISRMITLLEAAGAKTAAEQEARRTTQQAQTALQAIAAPPENLLALQEMAQFLIERAH